MLLLQCRRGLYHWMRWPPVWELYIFALCYIHAIELINELLFFCQIITFVIQSNVEFNGYIVATLRRNVFAMVAN